MNKQISISIKTILFTLFMILLGYIVYRLGDIFLLLLLSLLTVISIEPLVVWITKQKLFNNYISRPFAVVISYAFVIFILMAVFTIGIPPVIAQLRKLLLALSSYISEFDLNGGLENYVTELFKQINSLSAGLITTTLTIFQLITALLSLIVISIYLSLDWINIKNRLFEIVPNKYSKKTKEVFNEIENTIGIWIKGQVFLMISVGFISLLGLLILDIDYPLALALISGLLEFIPFIGPVVSAVLAGIVGFSISPIKGISVVILFSLIQQLENNLLVPKIMQRVSGFSPIVILLSILIGSEFFGVLGAIVAVPTMMIAYIFFKILYLKK